MISAGSQSTGEAPSLVGSNLQTSDSVLQISRIPGIQLYVYELEDEIAEGSPETMLEIIQDIINGRILPTKNPQLWKDVQDCLRNNEQLFQIFEASIKCLRNAQEKLSTLGSELRQQLSKEDYMVHPEILQEKLENFKAAVNPSLDDFWRRFSTTTENQRSTSENLEHRWDILDNKLESLKVSRKVLKVLSFVPLIISLGLLFLVSQPILVNAVVTLVSGHFEGPVHKWIDSFWKEDEDALEVERKLVHSMRRSNSGASTDLGEIKLAVDSLSTEILQILTQNVDHTTTSNDGGEAVLKMLLEKIEKTSGVCSNFLQGLNEKSGRCTLRVASTTVLKKVNEFAQKK